MDDTQEQDYEERLKEVFNSFDASGSGSLCTEELADLCQSLHLDDATPALLHALLQNQDRLTARVRVHSSYRCATFEVICPVVALWLSFLSLAGAYVEPLQLSGLCGFFFGALLVLLRGKRAPINP